METIDIDEYFSNKIVDYFNEYLSGSGLDTDWDTQYSTRTCLVISTSYHCMSEHGYYDGWQDFRVKFKKSDLADFSLQFTGYRSKYIWLLRDYLEDIIAYRLDQFIKDMTEGG